MSGWSEKGTLVSDPNLYEFGGKRKVAFRVCVKRTRKGDPQYVDVEAWGELAKMVASRLRKGDLVAVVDGDLRTDEWKDGETNRRRQYVNATFIFGGIDLLPDREQAATPLPQQEPERQRRTQHYYDDPFATPMP